MVLSAKFVTSFAELLRPPSIDEGAKATLRHFSLLDFSKRCRNNL